MKTRNVIFIVTSGKQAHVERKIPDVAKAIALGWGHLAFCCIQTKDLTGQQVTSMYIALPLSVWETSSACTTITLYEW